MPFNTAIFYDIENLLKGYNFSQQMMTNLSLREIVEAIKRTELVGQIAVQKAYANWSDPRLGMMRSEINELGIDPIQVFGFSREPKKNAADIQLAIDAVDLAYVRSTIDLFVIVSGDGGFAALAKKLHEYGKTVVGCAYRNAANKTFQAVCDTFVHIADPELEDRQEREEAAVSPTGNQEVTDPRNVRLKTMLAKCQDMTKANVVKKAKEILNWYASDAISRRDLAGSGIYLSVVQEAVNFAIPGFQANRLGFLKFIEFLQHACQGTPLCVGRPLHSQAVLFLRSSQRSGVEILPDLPLPDLESVKGYWHLLANANPIFRLPAPAEIQAIVDWLSGRPPNHADLGAIIESVVLGLNGAVSSDAVKLGILSLVSAEVFEREPEGVSLSEQKLTLHADARTPTALLAMLRTAARKKLVAVLGNVRDDIFSQLLGDA